jgi:hypothetical protein
MTTLPINVLTDERRKPAGEGKKLTQIKMGGTVAIALL